MKKKSNSTSSINKNLLKDKFVVRRLSKSEFNEDISVIKFKSFQQDKKVSEVKLNLQMIHPKASHGKTSILKIDNLKFEAEFDKEPYIKDFFQLYDEYAVDYYYHKQSLITLDYFQEKNKDNLENLNDDYFDENYRLYIYNNLFLIKNIAKFQYSKYYSNRIEEIDKLLSDKIKSSNKIFNKNLDLLIIDLDETLIHSQTYEQESNYFLDKCFNADYHIYEKEFCFSIKIRPYLKDFLINSSKKFNLILLSASNIKYIEKVLKTLEIEKYFYLVLDEQFCIQFGKINIKELEVFRQLYDDNCESEILIIDNNIFSFSFNIKQGILISSFKDNSNDKELILLEEYLDFLLNSKKISIYNRLIYSNEKQFHLEEILLNIDDEYSLN